MSITHTFVSAIADGADATLVRPVDWNAAHTGESVDITKATLTEQGDIIYASAASTPAALAHGTSGQALLTGGHGANPSWGAPSGLPTIVRKTADETVNNSSTLQSDDHLLLAVAANEVWEVFGIIISISASATPDTKFSISVPSGGALYGWCWNRQAADGAFIQGLLVTGASKSVACDTTAYTNFLFRAVIVNGATAGNIQFQWAQVTATAEDTKVLTNSCLIAHKLG